MNKIYKGDKLYHCYFNADEYPEGRFDATDAGEYLQCAIINMTTGRNLILTFISPAKEQQTQRKNLGLS